MEMRSLGMLMAIQLSGMSIHRLWHMRMVCLYFFSCSSLKTFIGNFMNNVERISVKIS